MRLIECIKQMFLRCLLGFCWSCAGYLFIDDIYVFSNYIRDLIQTSKVIIAVKCFVLWVDLLRRGCLQLSALGSLHSGIRDIIRSLEGRNFSDNSASTSSITSAEEDAISHP